MRSERVDVLVVGGGLGGVAAALAAARAGRSVMLTEETDWLGGQLTQQAVPPDEHPWIEQFGCTASYRRLRDGVREYYRRWFPLSERARRDRFLNPGSGRVGSLCHEPRVALAVIDALLAPHRGSGRLKIRTDCRPLAAEVDADRVACVHLSDHHLDEELAVEAGFVLDATETGELLPLTGTEYVTGFESRSDTDEPHAPEVAQPLNMQAVTHCLALDHRAGEDRTIDRPEQYDAWRSRRPAIWPGPLLGWDAPDPKTAKPRRHHLTPNPPAAQMRANLRAEGGADDLWAFRRIADRHNFLPGSYPSDITIGNWPMLDYFEGPLFEVTPEEVSRHTEGARQLSLSVLYWLQTEAPRPDGGTGYPGLRLRPDVVGTTDGLAKRPYIRESRRIRAQTTVAEQDLAAEVRGSRGAVSYPDRAGIGCYRIDLHPSTGGDGYIDVPAWPFEIPLGALLPVRIRNLLPAAKNAGTTHITNGCFRLHPTEWNIGEVAGLLAAHCLVERVEPHQVRAAATRLDAFQRMLSAEGVELRWPEVAPY